MRSGRKRNVAKPRKSRVNEFSVVPRRASIILVAIHKRKARGNAGHSRLPESRRRECVARVPNPEFMLVLKQMFIVKQSGFSAFAYDFFDSASQRVGTLRLFDVAIATNARLKNPFPKSLNQKIEMTYGLEHFEIEFDSLNRDWVNDIEFRLKSESETLAVAREIQAKKMSSKRPTIQIILPFEAELVNQSTLFGVRFNLKRDGIKLGSIAEKSWLSVRRQLTLELPDSIPVPIQFFWFFLVCNRSFR